MIDPSDLEHATLEDFQNVFLRPTKFTELAKILYNMLQIVATSQSDITALQNRDFAFEEELNTLDERVTALQNRDFAFEEELNTLDERVTALEKKE